MHIRSKKRFVPTFAALLTINEPSGTYWNSTNTQEGLFVSHSTQNTIIPLVAWQAVNEAGDTPDSVWGLAYRDSNNNISYPTRYYAMGNYSKFVREGYKVIGNSDANTLTA